MEEKHSSIRKIKSLTESIFNDVNIKTSFNIKPSFHYIDDISTLMNKINVNDYLLLQVNNGYDYSVYFAGNAYTLENSFFIFEGNMEESLSQLAEQTYLNSDGSIAYLFRINN